MLHILSHMLRTGILTEPSSTLHGGPQALAALQAGIQKTLGRALCIRHVDAGSCNGCELEIQALNNPYYNLESAGIRFVASPRHADLLLVTGPVSVNMEQALKRSYDAIPDPKWVVALGDCGTCGGVFSTSYASRGRVSNVIPVNLTISGCPPEPIAIMQGIFEAIHLSPGCRETNDSMGRKDDVGPP